MTPAVPHVVVAVQVSHGSLPEEENVDPVLHLAWRHTMFAVLMQEVSTPNVHVEAAAQGLHGALPDVDHVGPLVAHAAEAAGLMAASHLETAVATVPLDVLHSTVRPLVPAEPQVVATQAPHDEDCQLYVSHAPEVSHTAHPEAAALGVQQRSPTQAPLMHSSLAEQDAPADRLFFVTHLNSGLRLKLGAQTPHFPFVASHFEQPVAYALDTQQKPPTQVALAQWSGAEQVAPAAFFAEHLESAMA